MILINFLPVIVVLALCWLVIYKNRSVYESIKTDESHHSGGATLTGLLAGNVSSSFGVTIFWLLALSSFTNWGFPSFLCMVVGLCCAFVLYTLVVCKRKTYNTLLSFLYPNNVSLNVLIWYSLLSVGIIFVELIYLRIFTKALFEISGSSFFVANLSSITVVVIIGYFAVYYTMYGGLRAVLSTDKILMLFTLFVALFYVFFTFSTPFVNSYKNAGIVNLLFEEINFGNYDLSLGAIVNYIAAALYIFIMYLFMPDYWHRNVRVYSSHNNSTNLDLNKLKKILKSPKLFFAINIFCIVLVYAVAYIIAILSRLESNWLQLSQCVATKSFEFNIVLQHFYQITQSAWIYSLLLGVVVVSVITSIDSVIIGIVSMISDEINSFSNVDKQGRYKSIMNNITYVMFVVMIFSMIVDESIAIYVPLILASAQLLFVFQILFCRIISYFLSAKCHSLSNDSSRCYLYPTDLSLLVVFAFFSVLVVVKILIKNHTFYPVLSIISMTGNLFVFFYMFWGDKLKLIFRRSREGE